MLEDFPLYNKQTISYAGATVTIMPVCPVGTIVQQIFLVHGSTEMWHTGI